jgi:predicted RND superfamily exporter protein
MILLDGSPEKGNSVYDNIGSMRDYTVLLRIDSLETEINGNPDDADDEGIENAYALGIVDIMKMLRLPAVEFSDTYDNALLDILEDSINNYANISFWEILPLLPDDQQQRLINIFYGSLTIELRSLFVAEDYGSSILIVMMPALDVITTENAVNDINAITDDYNSMPSASHLTGFAAILVAINNMLVTSSVTSTVLALVLVFIILAFIFRSLKYSALTLIPVTLVVIWQPAILVGIGGLGSFLNPADPVFTGDLNLFSAIIGSIIVGIGIDFGVHMTERIKERGETVESVKHSVETSGMSFVEATATTLAGLSAVFLILIPAIQEFIILVMLLLVCSVLGAILILPAIYTLIFRHKAAKAARIEIDEEDIEEIQEEVEELTEDDELYGR